MSNSAICLWYIVGALSHTHTHTHTHTPGDVGHDAVQQMVLFDDRGFRVVERAAALDTGTLHGMQQLANRDLQITGQDKLTRSKPAGREWKNKKG